MEVAEAGYIPLKDGAKDVMSAKAILQRYISEIQWVLSSCLNMEKKVKRGCKIKESKNERQEESKSVVQFATENISNYTISYAGIDIPKNCDENKLHNEIKLEFGNMVQRECQQLLIKHEINKHEEDDGVKVKKLNNVFERCVENGENCEPELKCENFEETEYVGVNIKHEEIFIKTEEDTARFQENMLIHKNDSEVTLYSCELCTYKIKWKINLKRHMLIHKNISEVTMYSCEICTYKAKQKRSLKNHMLIHKNTSEVPMYSCEICTYKAKQKGSLKQHMLIHKSTSEVTVYSCEICTYKSKRRDVLKQHMLIHKSTSEVTMYSCEICTYKTKRKSHLKTHMLVHKNTSEVTMYSCEICTYKAKWKSDLKKHMLSHKSTSEVTMYCCEMCTYKSKHKSNLKKHMLIHRNVSE